MFCYLTEVAMKLRFARFKFKKEDFWIGIFWKKNAWCNGESLDIWICLLPMIPLHLQWTGKVDREVR